MELDMLKQYSSCNCQKLSMSNKCCRMPIEEWPTMTTEPTPRAATAPDDRPVPTPDDLLEPLALVVRGHHDDLTAVAARHGLSTSQARALIALNEPMPMSALATHLVCDASNATGLVGRMETRGLVLRTPAPDDRRSKVASRTPKVRSSPTPSAQRCAPCTAHSKRSPRRSAQHCCPCSTSWGSSCTRDQVPGREAGGSDGQEAGGVDPSGPLSRRLSSSSRRRRSASQSLRTASSFSFSSLSDFRKSGLSSGATHC